MGGPTPPLPGYAGRWIDYEVEGTVRLRVTFGRGWKVDTIEVDSVEMSSRGDTPWKNLEQLASDAVIAHVREWTTFAVSSEPEFITVRFRIDPDLGHRQVRYNLTYSKAGFIEDLEVVTSRDR